MSWRNDRKHYGGISRLLHWLMAAMIFTMLGLGWSMDVIPRDWKPAWLGTHKSLGIMILTLAIVRLAWRFYNAPPPSPEFMERWEKISAFTVHYLFYGLLLAMPVTGWAMTSAKGKPIMFLGMLQLPDL